MKPSFVKPHMQPLVTGRSKGTKQQRYLLSAKYCAFASLFIAFISMSELVTKVWTIAVVDAVLAVYFGYIAFAQYTLSRKAGGG